MRPLFILLFFAIAACRTGGSNGALKDAAPVSAGGPSCSNSENFISAANGTLTIASLLNGPTMTYKMSPINLFAAPTGEPEFSCTQGEAVFMVWTSQATARVGGSYFKLKKVEGSDDNSATSAPKCSDSKNAFSAANGTLTIASLVNGPTTTYKMSPINLFAAPSGEPELSCTQGEAVFKVWSSQATARVGGSYFKLTKVESGDDDSSTGAPKCSDGNNFFFAANGTLTIESLLNGPTMTYKMSPINLFAAPVGEPELSCTQGQAVFKVWSSKSLARVGGGYYKLAPN